MTFEVFLIVVGFVLGACFGSFFNVLIYRLPKNESIILPSSHCMSCGEPIRWYDNIPILSYFILRGKCRDCGTKFSIRYALVEFLTAILFATVVSKYSFMITEVKAANGGLIFSNYLRGTGITVFHLFFVGGMIVATFIDFDHQIIPNEITFPGIPLGIIASTIFPEMQGQESHLWGFFLSLISAVAAGGVLFLIGEIAGKILKKEAMGFGDVKLLAMIGAFIGWKLTAICIFFASLSGAVVGITLIGLKKVEWQSRIPFGPYIVLGALISYFWGARILEWYLGFFAKAQGI
jgi:leader peptidase (prepilin peptidase) / N-methyltransferase